MWVNGRRGLHGTQFTYSEQKESHGWDEFHGVLC